MVGVFWHKNYQKTSKLVSNDEKLNVFGFMIIKHVLKGVGDDN